MLTPGIYQAIVAGDPEWSYTKAGSERISLRFQVTQGELAGETIRWDGYFSPKTEERTLEALRFCGWTGDNISDLGELDQTVELDVQNEEYEGTVRPRVRWINRPGAMRFKDRMTEDDVRAFAARIKAKLKGTVTEDDVNF